MRNLIELDRRQLLGGAAAGLASAFVPSAATAQAPSGQLPARGEFVVRNAHVLTMDARLGDFERADVHVRAGEIIAVGPNLAAPGAETIDGADMIALPGLIDTHNHLWNTTWRNFTMEGPERGYFPVTLALGRQCTPEDMYRGVRLGVAELLYSGVTGVNDWAHNMRSPDYADAELRALKDTGIRGRLSYGTWQGGPPPDQTMNLADLARLQQDWASHSNEGLLSLGMASRSISASPRGAVSLDVIHRDWAGTRALGLPITLHTGAPGTVATLEREKLLGRDVQLVHPGNFTQGDCETVARAGCRVSMSPFTEMRGSQTNPLGELIKLGVKPSLSMDSGSVGGTNNMFMQMSVAMTMQMFRSKDPLSIAAKQILQMATINGAGDLGIDDKVGSLTPGKRADLILVRANDINMAPLGDPATALVRSAQPHNVDTVVVDGRILKRAGRMTALDLTQVTADAKASLEGLLRRAAGTYVPIDRGR